MKENLRAYRCHKVVHAGKIMGFSSDGETAAVVVQGGSEDQDIIVTTEWLEKHNPEVGGYVVIYSDDYMSYSPAAAFEGGYQVIGQ